MEDKKVTNFIVGLFVIIAAICFIWMSTRVTSSNDDSFGTNKNKINISAVFSNVGSLKSKAPVVISGVKVGRVNKIHLNTENFEAIVEMELYIPIPNDAQAAIHTAGLVGEQYISLLIGGSAENFKQGDQITRTQPALVIEVLIGKFLTSLK